MAEFSLVLGSTVFTPRSAEDLYQALEIIYCWTISWQLLTAGVSQTVLFICPPFPGCSSHSPALTGWRPAGVFLGASTHVQTECSGWRGEMNSNPMADVFLRVNGWPISETAHSAPARELLLLYSQSSFFSPLWQPSGSAASTLQKLPHFCYHRNQGGIVCPRFSETFLRYLPIAGELLL